MYTKTQMREGSRVLLSAMRYLETVCRDQDVDHRPWVSGDRPLSVAHWILAQRRFKATSMLRGIPGDPKVQAIKKRAFTSAQNARAGHSTSEVRKLFLPPSTSLLCHPRERGGGGAEVKDQESSLLTERRE